ncbi:glycosyltransferase [Rhabdaerophilum sp. SD176]|uniref:glycosyltransferase n=1 Tax=Rhabdaerophilum sp. SD176 TaxID=2983548 RepID=UPI0024DF4AEA|nr:glycosyltransferase [Rhabdaerophilum sp. SD176]
MIDGIRTPATTEQPVELELCQPSAQKEPALSVIIPLATGEVRPVRLLDSLPPSFEIILARGGTRASSMNRAAAMASGKYLWFVHADTILSSDAIEALQACLQKAEAIYYFDLRFDGSPLMRLTELGVHFRSRCFGIPFGDQALCLSHEAFMRLGGYDERTSTGEDHLLIQKAHRLGMPVRPVGVTVLTSARKYARNGWFRTTWHHLRLTFRQALLHR